jgi:cytidylate kinase
VDPANAQAVARVAQSLEIEFHPSGVFLAQQEVSALIRQEQVGNLASRLAPDPLLREALLGRQRAFRTGSGLVADGRDMGTIVFQDANLKIFLVADVLARAQRRCKQLIDKGISANLEDLLADMRERDARDIDRAVAPLTPAQDAHVVDSSHLTVDQTVQTILDLWSRV